MIQPHTRFAVVRLVEPPSVNRIENYLPLNYRVHSSHLAEPVDGGRHHVVIQGHDERGWTLDGYVIPRLNSGLWTVDEYPSLGDALDAACASMN